MLPIAVTLGVFVLQTVRRRRNALRREQAVQESPLVAPPADFDAPADFVRIPLHAACTSVISKSTRSRSRRMLVWTIFH